MQAVAQWLLVVSELASRSHLQDQVAAPLVAPQVAGGENVAGIYTYAL